MTLAELRRFRVPLELVEETEQALREAGRDGYELFVLWTGTIERDSLVVRTSHVPAQKSYRMHDELLVRVEGEALHELNTWLYESGEILAAQVHAHPGAAYHSGTDDSYPIVTRLGGISIVTPDFCSEGLFADGTAVYRLEPDGWIEQDRSLVEVVV
jgi:hypothetical protein